MAHNDYKLIKAQRIPINLKCQSWMDFYKVSIHKKDKKYTSKFMWYKKSRLFNHVFNELGTNLGIFSLRKCMHLQFIY